jgi:hypothetical protein
MKKKTEPKSPRRSEISDDLSGIFAALDKARSTFISGVKLLENPKGDYERIQLAKKAIREFMKFRVLETKQIKMMLKILNAQK